MIRYATAIRQGTATTEAILRRFTRSASHPTYQAMLEVGLRSAPSSSPDSCRVGSCNARSPRASTSSRRSTGANSVVYDGKGGETASNRQEEQEMTVLCLRILQAALST